jgi:hypothetical protein
VGGGEDAFLTFYIREFEGCVSTGAHIDEECSYRKDKRQDKRQKTRRAFCWFRWAVFVWAFSEPPPLRVFLGLPNKTQLTRRFWVNRDHFTLYGTAVACSFDCHLVGAQCPPRGRATRDTVERGFQGAFRSPQANSLNRDFYFIFSKSRLEYKTLFFS